VPLRPGSVVNRDGLWELPGSKSGYSLSYKLKNKKKRKGKRKKAERKNREEIQGNGG